MSEPDYYYYTRPFKKDKHVDLSEYSEEAVRYIHQRLRSIDVTVVDFVEALGIQRTTWYGWRAGTTVPSKETWQRVLRVAKRFGIK